MPQGSYHKFRTIFIVALVLSFAGCRPLKVVNTASDRIDTASPLTVDSSVLDMIEPYRDQLAASMEVVLATLDEDLIKEQPEGTLGNHVAAISYSAAQANYSDPVDFSIMNYGGLRVPYVNAGALRVQDAYQIMPFDNYVVIMKVDGATVLELANRMAAYGGWPVYKMGYSINEDGSATEVTINGKEVDPDAQYNMAISDYLAGGGDKLDLLKAFTYYNTGVLLRDAIIDYWRNAARSGKSINEQKDGRVRNK